MKAVIFTFILLTSLMEIYSQNSDWTYKNPLSQNDFYGIKFFNQNTGYVIGSGGIMLKNVSGSGNWINIPTYTTRDLYAMYFFDVNSGYIAGDGGTILYTSNGGANWTSLLQIMPMLSEALHLLIKTLVLLPEITGSFIKPQTE